MQIHSLHLQKREGCLFKYTCLKVFISFVIFVTHFGPT